MSPFCKKLHLVGLLCPYKAKGLMKALVKENCLGARRGKLNCSYERIWLRELFLKPLGPVRSS